MAGNAGSVRGHGREFCRQSGVRRKDAHAAVLTGVVARAPDGAPLNSALLMASNGVAISRYDKVNLVPFGEFVPWPFGLTDKESIDGSGRFRSRAGRSLCRRLGATRSAHSSATSRCSRVISGSSQHPARKRSSTFRTTAGSARAPARYQHLQIVRMRAAENARWILRATDNGITAVIDPAGRVVRTTQEYARTGGPLSVSIPPGSDFLHSLWRLVRRSLRLARRGSSYECRITSTSPSLTMYSLPSRRSRPFSRTPG